MDDPENRRPDTEDDEAGYVTMNFRLVCSNLRPTRADNTFGHTETDSDWAAFEDKIDINDFAFFIFVEGTDKAWPLVMKMTHLNDSTTSDSHVTVTKSPGAYSVTAKIPAETLKDQNIGKEDVNFRIIVLANAGSDHSYEALGDLTTYNDVITQVQNWIFEMSSIYNNDGSTSAIRDLYAGAIPMFGQQSFTVKEDELFSPRPEYKKQIGDIFMVRALAKIKVVDNIQNKSDEGFPRIESVTFQGWRPNAYIVPSLTGYENGYQVETARPTETKYNESTTIKLGKLDPTDDADNTWFGFIPEQMIGSEETPKLSITITYEADAQDKPLLQETFEVPMSGDYKGQELDFGNAILRNHIYTLNVSLDDRNLFCTVTVFPYTAVTLNPFFGFSVPVESVHIKTADSSAEVSEVTVAEGQTVSLIGYVEPKDANNKDITWSSKDTSIAKVAADGLVTGISVGETTITARSVDNPTKNKECTIKVTQKIPVESISLNLDTWTGNIGETVNLIATVEPAKATNKNIKWRSDDENIATVSSYGTVTAVDGGTGGEGLSTKITATSVDDPEISATCIVTVNPRVWVEEITLSGDQPNPFYQGNQFSLIATVVKPSNPTSQEIIWESDNPDIATVSSYGLVTAISSNEGEAIITATAKYGVGPNAKKTYKVKVSKKIPVTGLKLSPDKWDAGIGNKQTLSLEFTSGTSEQPTNKSVVWTSSDPSVAVMTSPTSNTIEARGKGTATITATSVDDPEISATCIVTVK
ncbi:MAG: Ig-like domain-containing protein [Muribaculaceae bacterium]|nr:Ig-like domain-containing protein [Muribaculaceae bacterium]